VPLGTELKPESETLTGSQSTRKDMLMPKPHDRGGRSVDDPIEKDEHAELDWERQTAVLPNLLKSKGIMVSDELRRGH
jgi:hypothetical protein